MTINSPHLFHYFLLRLRKRHQIWSVNKFDLFLKCVFEFLEKQCNDPELFLSFLAFLRNKYNSDIESVELFFEFIEVDSSARISRFFEEYELFQGMSRIVLYERTLTKAETALIVRKERFSLPVSLFEVIEVSCWGMFCRACFSPGRVIEEFGVSDLLYAKAVISKWCEPSQQHHFHMELET